MQTQIRQDADAAMMTIINDWEPSAPDWLPVPTSVVVTDESPVLGASVGEVVGVVPLDTTRFSQIWPLRSDLLLVLVVHVANK